MTTTENDKLEQLIPDIASGLTDRLRSLALALDRLDRLESGSGRWLSDFSDVELPDAAIELTLRALQTGAEATNFAIMKSLAAEDSMTIGRLMASSNLGRLVLSERLNDLVQVGMATRLIDTDHAQITAAGAAMVALINEIAGRIAAKYSDGQTNM